MDTIIDDLTNALREVRSVEQFKDWSKTRLRTVLPHGALICGLGHLHAGGVGLDFLVTVDFPAEHIETIRNRVGAVETPILRRWLDTEEPVYFDADDPWPGTPAVWLESFRRHRMRNVLAHACYDRNRCVGTYHSVYRLPGGLAHGYVETLRGLVPHLHEALYRVIELTRRAADEPEFDVLTERERTMLSWLKLGKTNAEIARFVELSENTVKHHVSRIYDKLGIPNRAHLVRYLAEREERRMPGLGPTVL